MAMVRRARNLARRVLPPWARSAIRRIVPAPLTEFGRPLRRFSLAMPVPPNGLGRLARPAATPGRLRVEAPIRSYVPKLLDEHGIRDYEPETLAAFLAAITALEAEEAFDVGANIGVFAIVAAATTRARVTGFEPTPALAGNFRAIVAANGLSCEVEEIALGAAPGTATLYLSSVTDSSNSLRSGFRPATGSVDVAVERLDDIVERTGRRPRVLKVDTETTEPDVLAGGHGFIASDRPWIICEVLAGRTEAQLEPMLRDLGYHLHHLRSGGPPVPRDRLAGDADHRERDWLFTPVPLSDEFLRHHAAWLAALRATRR